MTCAARAQLHTVAEQYLFQSINQERAAVGLPALKWSQPLTHAAQDHAVQMRAAGAISHQFRGEADLTERASSTGTRFSRVSENVATSISVLEMHTALMNSPHHRENILDAKVNSIGISVVQSGRQLWGVEDFARDVPELSYLQQEARVAQLVLRAGIANVEPSPEAREICRMSTGFAGDRPAFVMRYTASDLDRLPSQLTHRLKEGGVSSAAVGACSLSERTDFTSYNIAVVLYR
ncbi:CAP domain-containing protein [Terriglobus roseus]|nr:CAP domain-containing protein [Terriglobus roseus]